MSSTRRRAEAVAAHSRASPGHLRSARSCRARCSPSTTTAATCCSLVGGYDYERSEFNRAVQALRQPGSAFKPFIYGAALEKGYTPVSKVIDRPVVYTDPISGFVWAPRNYGRQFYGPMPMRNALKKSINNATVHLFRDVGVDFVIDYARRFGIQSPLSPRPLAGPRARAP